MLDGFGRGVVYGVVVVESFCPHGLLEIAVSHRQPVALEVSYNAHKARIVRCIFEMDACLWTR
jgi:hypothetical protein